MRFRAGMGILILLPVALACGQDRMFYWLVTSNKTAISGFSREGVLTWSNTAAAGNYLILQNDNLLSNNWQGFKSGAITSVWSTVNLFASDETKVDDFEAAGAPAPWTFSNGSEFPGAQGSLTLGAGHTGQGASLAYDFSGGGKYVSAGITLSQPASGAALALWLNSPAGIHINLRIVDESGQTLQYNTYRPPDAMDAAAWYRAVVNLALPSSHWGGANDGVVHGTISRVYVLAADPVVSGAQGTVLFDDVQIIGQAPINLNPFQMSLTPAPAGSSNLAERLAVNIHFANDPVALDAAKSAGFTWVRMDLFWVLVETTAGVYDFSRYDKLIADLDARNMRALFILDFGNPLYTGGDKQPPTNAVAIQAFGNFAEAAARHFAGHGVWYEIWNEPNITTFWPPQTNAAQYAALATATVVRVHAGDPQAKVTTAGIASTDCSFLCSYLAAGGGVGADAIGAHPYRSYSPETATDDILAWRAIIRDTLPANPPVWDTEWGYSSAWFGDGHSSGARAQQAVMVSRELLTAWSLDFPLMVYYDIRDDGSSATNAEHNFGLLAQDYSDKPAMTAVKTLSALAAGRQYVGVLPMQPTSVYALRLDGPTDVVVALWTRNGETTVLVPTNTTAIDLYGQPLTFQAGGPRSLLTINSTNGPVYLTFPKP